MKLHLDRAAGRYSFSGCGAGYVLVNDERRESPLLVMTDRLENWNVSGFDTLEAAHFAAIVQFQPEVVLFGTGTVLRFPRPELLRALVEARIGFEAMDTRAACRTFNVLASEGRKVAAAVLID